MRRLRLTGLVAVVALIASGCSFGTQPEDRFIDVYFSRAVQVFPGNSVRVLGVEVGRVVEVENAPEKDAVRVHVRIDDPDIVLPADVEATIVPVSLLGERYVQLLPAYDGGEKFTGSEIPVDRTSVPVEQDELLRSLQDYFGELDPGKVSDFVTQISKVLQGNGEDLNRLIKHGSGVIKTLSDKRDTLADLIRNFNTVTQTLSTRQEGLASLINTYNAVVSTLNENRSALEGTITGLNQASAQLASLLTEHRNPLGADIKALTRTSRTLTRNVNRLARTGHHAHRLFSAASRAMDFERDWLRLNNQGEPLFELLEYRLRDRLVGVCIRLDIKDCQTPAFWAAEMPHLFCLQTSCPKAEQKKTPGDRLNEALKRLPPSVGNELSDELGNLTGDGGRQTSKPKNKKKCKDAKFPRRCRLKKQLDPGQTLDELLEELQSEVEGATGGIDDLTGGGLP